MNKPKVYNKASTSLFALFFAAGLLVGGILTFYITLNEVNQLGSEIAGLQNQLSNLGFIHNATYQNVTIYQNASALADIYARVRDSVVLIQGTTAGGGVQGSGFVHEVSSRMVVITNYHVVHDTSALSVTFSNGMGYAASILGTDPYADLAVISVDAPSSEFKPVEIVSS